MPLSKAEEERAADLLVEFGRSHGAFNMVRGDRPVIDDYEAALDFVLTDDSGMDSYDHNSQFTNFPLALHFKAQNAEAIAGLLKTHLDAHGFTTDEAPSLQTSGAYRVMPSVFVRQRGQDVEVTAHQVG